MKRYILPHERREAANRARYRLIVSLIVSGACALAVCAGIRWDMPPEPIGAAGVVGFVASVWAGWFLATLKFRYHVR